MGKWMTEQLHGRAHNEKLEETLGQCQEWKERYQRVKLSDTGMWTNQNLSFARATEDMIILAEAILKGALMRNESRGAHYKPAFPSATTRTSSRRRSRRTTRRATARGSATSRSTSRSSRRAIGRTGKVSGAAGGAAKATATTPATKEVGSPTPAGV
jgi:hypothetical protein